MAKKNVNTLLSGYLPLNGGSLNGYLSLKRRLTISDEEGNQFILGGNKNNFGANGPGAIRFANRGVGIGYISTGWDSNPEANGAFKETILIKDGSLYVNGDIFISGEVIPNSQTVVNQQLGGGAVRNLNLILHLQEKGGLHEKEYQRTISYNIITRKTDVCSKCQSFQFGRCKYSRFLRSRLECCYKLPSGNRREFFTRSLLERFINSFSKINCSSFSEFRKFCFEIKFRRQQKLVRLENIYANRLAFRKGVVAA